MAYLLRGPIVAFCRWMVFVVDCGTAKNAKRFEKSRSTILINDHELLSACGASVYFYTMRWSLEYDAQRILRTVLRTAIRIVSNALHSSDASSPKDCAAIVIQLQFRDWVYHRARTQPKILISKQYMYLYVVWWVDDWWDMMTAVLCVCIGVVVFVCNRTCSTTD